MRAASRAAIRNTIAASASAAIVPESTANAPPVGEQSPVSAPEAAVAKTSSRARTVAPRRVVARPTAANAANIAYEEAQTLTGDAPMNEGVPPCDNVDALISECFAGDISNTEQAAQYASQPARAAAAARSTTKKATGRGPGRPRKQDTSSSISVKGVSPTPQDSTNTLELEHHSPTIFRKLVLSLNAYEVSEVDMIFDNSGMHIRTKCSLQKNNIYFDVDGACMSWYYCERPISVTVKLSSLVSAVERISRYHDQIAFMIKRAALSKLFIVTHETEMGGKTTTAADVVTRQLAEMPAAVDDEAGYPISFQFSSAELKKLIANARKMSDSLQIERDGHQPLQITIQQNGLRTTHVYPADKIRLQGNMGENSLITSTVPTSYVKKFTDTIIGDSVVISVDSEKNMCFSSSTGKRDDRWAFVARVFIQLKK